MKIKKGDFFNQIAIITELIEQCNINSVNSTLIFELESQDFYRFYRLVQQRANEEVDEFTTMFTMKIGDVEIIFNMSNS